MIKVRPDAVLGRRFDLGPGEALELFALLREDPERREGAVEVAADVESLGT